MVFCGQCGYQLAPGDEVCPRCGTKAEVAPQTSSADTYNPTEISHAILENPRLSQTGRNPSQPRPVVSPDQGGPLVLGGTYADEQLANEPTSMMSAQMYAQQPASYANYPVQAGYQQPVGTGAYQFNPAYQQYQAAQATALAELMDSSRRGKTTSLLLVLFGLVLLIAAMVVFLLTIQGILFS